MVAVQGELAAQAEAALRYLEFGKLHYIPTTTDDSINACRSAVYSSYMPLVPGRVHTQCAVQMTVTTYGTTRRCIPLSAPHFYNQREEYGGQLSVLQRIPKYETPARTLSSSCTRMLPSRPLRRRLNYFSMPLLPRGPGTAKLGISVDP